VSQPKAFIVSHKINEASVNFNIIDFNMGKDKKFEYIGEI
jgi:hypothetical protein